MGGRIGRCGLLLLPLTGMYTRQGGGLIAEAAASSSQSLRPTMRDRTITLGGSCRLSVAPSLEVGPKFRLEVLRSISQGLRIAGLSADIGLNITRSCLVGASASKSGSTCLRLRDEDMLDGEASGEAFPLHASVRLDTSPVPTTTVSWVLNRLSDLTPISGAVAMELRKIIGVLHSDVSLEYLFNITDRENSEQPQDHEGYSSHEAVGLPHTIGAPRNTASGKLPFLRFEWDEPYSYPVLYKYVGELYRMDLGITESWSGNGTADNPMTDTEVLFSGAGDHGLEARRQYKFRVRGVNANGEGAWSEWSSLTEEPRGVCVDAPAVPANFRRHPDVAVGGFIKLTWDAPANEEQAGGDYLSNMTYEVWGGPREAVLLPMEDPTATEFNRSVPVGGSWHFQVRAMNAGKRSDFTPELQLLSGPTPVTPNLAAASPMPGIVWMLWSTPAGDGSMPITHYELSNDSFVAVVVPAASTATQHILEGQQAGTRTYSIRAVNAVGYSPVDSQVITVA